MHELKIPIRFRDLDALGHLNSGVITSFMEAARVEFFHAIAGNAPWFRPPFILGALQCEFLSARDEPGTMTVSIWVSRIGRSSWDFDYAVRDEDGKDVAIGRTAQIYYDYEAGRPSAIPDAVRSGLEKHSAPRLKLRTDTP